MKKFLLSTMMFAAVAMSFVSCSKKNEKAQSSSAKIRVAMVTDSGDITDQSFNQTTYTTAKAYCEDHGLDFTYYKPAGDSTADRVASIDAAVQDGFNVVILPGYLFAEPIVETSSIYKDVTFIGLDVGEFDLKSSAQAHGDSDYSLPANVFCAVYDEEIPGFMAGYAAVKEGYRHLGFLGGMAVPAVIRYGFGYVQGINAAAVELGIADKVTVEYVYGGQFYGDQQIKAAMDGWYKNRGVEVVFSCGGGIWQSAADAAKDANGKVIGVDTDQSAQINSYKEDMCVTSAMKGLGATVRACLAAIENGKWSDYSGKVEALGLVSGTNPELNYVQLPTDTWSMKNFTIADYNKLVADIYSGNIKVDNSIDKDPAVSVTFNKYPNIK